MRKNNFNDVHKSGWVSLIGIGASIALVGVGWLLAAPKGQDKPLEEPTFATEAPNVFTETAPSETETGIINPFIKTMAFKRLTTTSGNSAILEIKVEPTGEYVIKECITGEIVSRGIWSYAEDTALLTLTEVGSYPYINIFRLEKYQENNTSFEEQIRLGDNETSVDMLSSNSADFTPEYQLAFITESSTNIKYELLNKYDIFVEQEQKALPEQTQLSYDNGKKGDVNGL